MELKVLKIDGTESGKTVVLDEKVFGVTPNDHAIYLDVVQYLANQIRTLSSRNGALYYDEIVLRDKFDDRKIHDLHALVAHMTGHAHSREYT